MKFLDLTGLNKFWAKLKGYFAKLNLTYGTRGFVSGVGSNPEILLEKMKLGTMQLYNGPYGISVKLYVYDADDEANATLVWDSTTLEGEPLEKFTNGRDMGTIYTSPAGKCVKAVYDGHAAGAYYYIRAFGVFMTPKQADSSHKATAVCKINGTNYASYTVDTYGGLVTTVCPDGNYTYLELKFTPNTDDVRMRFYGFRCLNTYDGADAVLLGRATSALSATKATQDSDGNAINATYFKANTSTTTLQSGTAVKVGTQNGADVKLQLPTIPAAANNGTLKIGLNGGTATSKFTADQSSDSTLTFASGTTAGTIKVDGTEVAVAGWSGKQDAMFVKFEFDSTLLYSDVTAAILNKAVPYLLDGNTMYVCDGNTWSVEVSNSTTTEYRFVAVTGNTSSPRISYRYIRANDSKGTGIISLATSSSVSSVAGSRFPYYEVDNPDWDDLTNTGEYAVTNSAAPNASPSKHSPEQGAVSARVYSIYSGSNLFITQIAVGDDMYYRAKFGSGNWSAWQYFIRSADVNRIVKGSLGSDPKTFYVV